MKQMSRKIVLKKFFGYKPGDTLKEFTAELKELSDEEETELATLAAAEMGVELVLSK